MLALLLLSALMICDDEFHVATISHIITLQRIQGEFNPSWVASVAVHALTMHYGVQGCTLA